jgi:hypothetical protein
MGMPLPHLKPDPIGHPRHGLVVYLLFLCVLSGVTLLIGEPAAGSLESALDREIVAGLVTKRLGYAGLTFASTIYALVIIATFQREATLVGGILLGFAYACAHTWYRINQRIHEILDGSR